MLIIKYTKIVSQFQMSDCNEKITNGETELHLAIKKSNKCRVFCSDDSSSFETIEALLKNGANVNAKTPTGNTPLHLLVDEPMPPDVTILRLLLDHKADLNAQNNSGQSPLTAAIRCRHSKIVQTLVEHGADVNIINPVDGSTPLHLASCSESLEMIKFLMKMGADIDAMNFEGRTPLTHLLFIKSGFTFEKLLSLFLRTNIPEKVLVFLLKYSNVNSIDSHGWNILYYDPARREILKHVTLMLALELTVDPGIQEIIYSGKSDGYSDYFCMYFNELELAKSKKLNSTWITFFNLLVDNKRKLKNYAGNEDLINDFKNSDCLKMFPFYGKQMQKNVEKGIRRRKVFDKSTVLLSDCIPIFDPFHLIVTDVLDCVSTENLFGFCENISE